MFVNFTTKIARFHRVHNALVSYLCVPCETLVYFVVKKRRCPTQLISNL